MHSGKMTKIVATIGPASDDVETIKHLIKAGVNVFRFNMKHNVKDWHEERIVRVQKCASELGITIGVLIDLQGPEIRINTPAQITYEVKIGDLIYFTENPEDISTEYPTVILDKTNVLKHLIPEDKFSIDDGFMEFETISSKGHSAIAKVLDQGKIKNRKSLNLIGKNVDLPSLTEDDLLKIDIASRHKVDFIALSYVRTASDVKALRKEISIRNVKSKIVSKVENEMGVDNIDEIIDATDAVMVARGDLGVEVPIEKLALMQKQIITKCRLKNKQVIVATQMLQSMVENSMPTRAEATDIANAVFDGTDAIMLSNETAAGKYPVKAVEIMRKIARYNETHADFSDFTPIVKDQTNAIVKSAITLINSNLLHIDKIIVFTDTGYTARVVSSYRQKKPVIAVSSDKESIEALTLCYGVIPIHLKFPNGEFTYNFIDDRVKEIGQIKDGETILVIHGRKWHDPGQTNAVVIYKV